MMPWSLLGILCAVCAVLCAVGFYKFVYFLSIGYGFAVAGGGIAVLVMALVTGTEAPIWVLLIQAALFLAYGIRLSGFLLVRELKNVTFGYSRLAQPLISDSMASPKEKMFFSRIHIFSLPLQLNPLRECFLSHDSPHFVNICQGVEILIVVVIEGTLQSHLIYTVLLRAESQKFGQPKLEAVHFL